MTPKCKYWWSARRINIFLLSKVSRKKNTFPKLIYYPYTASRNRNYNILELYENYKNSFKTTATTRNKQTTTTTATRKNIWNNKKMMFSKHWSDVTILSQIKPTHWIYVLLNLQGRLSVSQVWILDLNFLLSGKCL